MSDHETQLRNKIHDVFGKSHSTELSAFTLLDKETTNSLEKGDFLDLTDEDRLSYLDALTPGWRETYKKEFGREPNPEGLARLIARGTGVRKSVNSGGQEAPASPERTD